MLKHSFSLHSTHLPFLSGKKKMRDQGPKRLIHETARFNQHFFFTDRFKVLLPSCVVVTDKLEHTHTHAVPRFLWSDRAPPLYVYFLPQMVTSPKPMHARTLSLNGSIIIINLRRNQFRKNKVHVKDLFYSCCLPSSA